MLRRVRFRTAAFVGLLLVAGAIWASRFAALATPRVILIGIDGADPRILERLIGEGQLPTFARLRREGAYGTLRSREPMLSPILWTSIATGRKPQDHGVLDFVEIDGAGRTVPITSSRRRTPALWNILDRYGRRSGFIGWYASFPVEPVHGFEISDRMAFHQVRSERAVRDGTFPPELADKLHERFGDPAPNLASTAARFLEEPRARLTADGARRLEQLARIHATTEWYRRITPYLQATYRPELLGVYFEAIDACGHLFMEDAPPRRPRVADRDFAAFSGTVDRCYRYQDEVLGEILALASPRTLTIVVSDHGFKSGGMRPDSSGRADVGLAPLWHSPNGVVLLHGGSVRPGTRIGGAGILDVAPTVLQALSLPLSLELAGRPIQEAFAAKAGRPQARIDRYRWTPPPGSQPIMAQDSERIAELRALGYVSSTDSQGHDDNGRTAASYINEGISLAGDGELDAARRAYQQAVRLDPRNVNARAFAARVHLQRREFKAAQALLDEALALEPGSAYVRLLRASRALDMRRSAEAAVELDAARAIDSRLPMLHLLTARLHDAAGRSADALDALTTAEALADADGLLSEMLLLDADIATRLRQVDRAEAALDRAAGLSFNVARLASARGDLALARNDASRAADYFRQALAADPGSPARERKLGQALGAAGHSREAEAAFRRAITRAAADDDKEAGYGDLSLLFQSEHREDDALATLQAGVSAVPRSAALWGMLGAAYGRRGTLDLAIDAYERSVALAPTPLGCKTLAALVFEERHDRVRAVALWKQSLALDANQPDVHRFLRTYGGAASRAGSRQP